MAIMQRVLRGLVRIAIRPLFNPRVSFAAQRRGVRLVTGSLPRPGGCRYEAVTLGGIGAERVQAVGAEPCTAILYLHGGAYCVGSPQTHRAITGHLARSSGAAVYALDYRLAPEHPYPAALDDALMAYRALLDQGFTPQRIAVAGDSAGGGLTLSLTLALRDAGLPLPAALALLSPFVDAGLTGDSVLAMRDLDPMLSAPWLLDCVARYRGGLGTDAPLSPLFADLSGLPPTMIEVGSEEILRSDAERLDARARAAGVEVRFRCWDGLWHVFQLHAGLLAPATDSLRDVAGFFQLHWKQG